MKNKIYNIVFTYNTAREILEKIEQELNNIDKKTYYTEYYERIDSHDAKHVMIETLYMDSFILLSYKNKKFKISNEEKKIYFELFKAFCSEEISLKISFNTNEKLRNDIIKIASIYRKQDKLSKACIISSLDETCIGILQEKKFRIDYEIKSYNLSINDIKEYICNNSDKKDLSDQVLKYFKSLFLENTPKYKRFMSYIRTYNSINNKNKTTNEEEILKFIKIIVNNKQNNKIIKFVKGD